MSEDVKEGFVRQRRNLISLSALLIFVELANVKLKDGTINLFGTHIEISDPAYIKYALWIMLAYWLVRYVQYKHDLPTEYIADGFDSELRRRLIKCAEMKAWERTMKGQGADYTYSHGKSIIHSIGIGKSACIVEVSRLNGHDKEGFHKNFENINLSIEINGSEFNQIKLASGMHVNFITRLFSEYTLPIVMPGLAILAILFRVAFYE